MKKLLYVSLMVLTLTVSACGKKEPVKEEPKPVEENPKIEDKLDDVTEEVQGDLRFSDINIKAQGAINIVSGKVKNESKESKTFTATLLMKTEEGRILGKVSKEFVDLKAGEETTFEIQIMGDYSNLATFEVTIEKN